MGALQFAVMALCCTAIVCIDLKAIRRLLQSLLQEIKKQRQ